MSLMPERTEKSLFSSGFSLANSSFSPVFTTYIGRPFSLLCPLLAEARNLAPDKMAA